jgi:hypothetical protein
MERAGPNCTSTLAEIRRYYDIRRQPYQANIELTLCNQCFVEFGTDKEFRDRVLADTT